MSFSAFDDAREQVRQAVDLVDLVRSYIDLQPQGRDFVGICPWHDDSRPSLRVNRERQFWKCWVCNVGGDLFSFVMRRENIGFREALEMLADRAGVTLRPTRSSQSPGTVDDKRTLYQAVAWAEEQFHQFFLQSPQAEPARQYVRQRGISEESVRRYRLGFSPYNWQWLLDRAKTTPFAPQILEAVGLANRNAQTGNYYDFFRGRLIFPIRDPQKRAIAFGGRLVPGVGKPDDAKYQNSRETRLYSKSEQLYGLDVVRDTVQRHRRITVMEGYTDVIIATQHGLDDAVAVCGTALGQRHLQLLKRYADRVTLVLDGDEAGMRRTNEILEMFVAQQVDLRILTLPNALDPADFLAAEGIEAFCALADQAVDALQHKIRSLTQGLDVLNDTHRANVALEEILRVLALVPVGESASAARLREQQVLARLARQFQVADSQLRLRLQELRRARPAQPQNQNVAPTAGLSLRSLPVLDVQLLEILSLDPQLLDMARAHIPLEVLSSEPGKVLYRTYQELADRHGQTEVGQVMAILEDVELKSLLVEIDEQALRKSQCSELSAAQQLQELIEHLHQRQQELDGRRCLHDLARDPGADKELDVLQQIVALTRQRQGLTAPTDG